jgi:hypothetical protein
LVEDTRYLMLGPSALAPLSDHERRRIDHAVLKPPQNSALADRQQSRHGCIR